VTLTSQEAANLGSFLSGVAGVLTVLVASLVGWRGFKTWKDQLRGTAKFQVARKVLRAAYEFETQLRATRSAGFTLDTMPNETPAGIAIALRWAGQIEREYYRRLARLGRAAARLRVAQTEARVLLSRDDADLIDPLQRLHLRLELVAGTYFPDERRRLTNRESRESKPGLADEHAELFETRENDEISGIAAEAMTHIAERFSAHLK